MRSAPLRASLTMVVVLWLTGWNALRAWTSTAWQQPLSEYGIRTGSTYLLASGALWAGLGSALIIGLLSRRKWSGPALIGASVALTIWYWLERLLLQQPRPNWPFTAGLNLVVLLLIASTGIALAKEAHD